MQLNDVFSFLFVFSALAIAVLVLRRENDRRDDRRNEKTIAILQEINNRTAQLTPGKRKSTQFGCFFTAIPADLDVTELAENPDGDGCWPNIGDSFYAHCDNCDFYTLVTAYRDWTVSDGSSEPPRCLCDICACTSLASIRDDLQMSGIAKSMAFLFNVVISGTGSRSILENNLETGVIAGTSFRLVNFDEGTEVQIITDGFGNFAFKFCPKCGGEVQPVRPGKFQCPHCD